MKMYHTPQSVEKYLNVHLECNCGRTHYVPIKAVKIGQGAIESVPTYVKQFGYKRPYIICDEITYRIAGEKCGALLLKAGIEPTVHILKHMGFDESTLGEIVVGMPPSCDVMIGCGTGSITDMLRYSSYKLRLPCFTVATAAPMDGFASSIGIMNIGNLKTTMPAHNSDVILGDTDILKAAPYRMTIAGFGDLMSKFTCLNDWKLAKIINDEHCCERIVEIVENCVETALRSSGRIRERDPEALGDVMRGLVLAGSTISLYGDSRPASASEHHMSHYWDTLGIQRGKPYAMHGEQVAVGSVLVLRLIEELLRAPVDFERAREGAKQYNYEEWKQSIHSAFGSAAQEVIDLEEKARKNDTPARLKRISSMEARWPEIVSQLKSLPSSEYLRGLLADGGCPCEPHEIGITDEILKNTFLYCKEVRPRYTVLQMVWDLGLMEELADKVIAG